MDNKPHRRELIGRQPRGISGEALGLIFSIAYLAFWGFVYLGMLQGGSYRPDWSMNVIMRLGFVGFIYSTVRYSLLRRRRKALAAQESSSERTTENTVLYLRSFRSDLDSSIVISKRTEEEHLALVFSQIGPFLAIGKPGEPLPELGASRLYVEQGEWKETVLNFLMDAKIVVLRIGQSPGFWWEFEKALKIFPLDHLVLLIPDNEETYSKFRLRAAAHFLHPLPEPRDNGSFADRVKRRIKRLPLPLLTGFALSPGHMGTLDGAIYFDKDSVPHRVKFGLNWVRGTFASPGIPVINRALRPFFEQINGKIRRSFINPLKILALIWGIYFYLVSWWISR